MNPDPLLPVLRAVAEIVLSRPRLAAETRDLDRFVAERRPMLLEALIKVPGLRDRIRDRVRPPRDQRDAWAHATLLLAEDDEIVRAALLVCEQLIRGESAADRRLRRHHDKIQELRRRLDTIRGRLGLVTEDLRTTRASLRAVEKRAEDLAARASAAQRRLSDPQATASALLTSLQRRPGTPKDERDPPRQRGGPEGPRNHQDPRGSEVAGSEVAGSKAAGAEASPLVVVAAGAAGIEPGAFLAALRALADPPGDAPVSRAVVAGERSLRVVPLGGDTQIGGSCLLVEAGGTRVLIDAGLSSGESPLPPRDIATALTGPLHGIVITHAHVDHCGYVPGLVSRIPRLRVLATAATTRLMPRMWADSAKLMGDRERVHREWGADSEALYPQEAVKAAARRCEEVPYGVERRIGDLTLELFPAGHILGAAGVVIRAGDQRIVVTGDISGFRQETVDGYRIPDTARDADLLVMESTCCAENHKERETRVADLVRAVGEIWATGGRVLIPAFALGRAQELALIMRTYLPHVPVILDGMAADITASFEEITADWPSPLRILGGNLARAKRPGDLDLFSSGVVITTSGMLTGGPAVQWARRILPEPGSALFLSGYQDEESGGSRLLRLAEEGAADLRINDQGVERRIPLRARVRLMRLSAHADKQGLLEIADEVSAREVMLVHGLQPRQRQFAEILRVRHHTPAPTSAWGHPASTGSREPP